MPVPIVRMLASKMMSLGREPDFFGQQLVGALADRDLAVRGDRLAFGPQSNAMTTAAAP